ncbi:MAG: DEAD/DEAH box helicase [Thermoplasmata archaeon]
MALSLPKDLRPYQQEDYLFLLKHPRAIFADVMGLGKTYVVTSLLRDCRSDLPENVRILILCRRNAFAVWEEHFALHLPDIEIVVVQKTPPQRQAIWVTRSETGARAYLCSYASFIRDAQLKSDSLVRWDIVICDEYHRMLLSRKTKTFKALRRVRSQVLWFLSGTPARRGAQNLWPALHLIKPHMFPSYWKFINTYCWIENTPFGMQIMGVRNPGALRALLRNHMIRHTKEQKQVALEMPPKTRQMLPTVMDSEQAGIYKALSEDLMVLISVGDDRGGASLIAAPNKLAAMIKMRQLLVCPKILDPSLGYGAGIKAILEKADELDKPHFAIFTPFRPALPHIEACLRKEGYKTVVQLKGGMSSEALKAAITEVKAEEGVAIGTILYAESFEIETMSYGFMLGYEWTADDNEQAEDRIHRLISPLPVNIYYVRHSGTIDDHIMDIVNQKYITVNKFLRDPENLRKVLS